MPKIDPILELYELFNELIKENPNQRYLKFPPNLPLSPKGRGRG
jgi:hypothetical protein